MRNIKTILFCATLALFVFSCDKDDDNGLEDKSLKDYLSGKWLIEKILLTDCDGNTEDATRDECESMNYFVFSDNKMTSAYFELNSNDDCELSELEEANVEYNDDNKVVLDDEEELVISRKSDNRFEAIIEYEEPCDILNRAVITFIKG